MLFGGNENSNMTYLKSRAGSLLVELIAYNVSSIKQSHLSSSFP